MAGAMIKSLDDSVGKILAALDNSGQAGNTLVVFTSDNGGLSYEEDGLREANTSNLPLRGRKGSEYEGGIRVPWIVRWPGHVPAGVHCDVPVHQVDLFPTFAAIGAGQSPAQTLHGVDLTALFQRPDQGLAERNLYWYLPGYSAFHQPSVMVRRGRWKLICSLETGACQLYDTVSDIGEARERHAQRSELTTMLKDAALRWLDDLDAPRMSPNPDYASR
jgi:arylsulfatase A-like enzyme